MTPTALQTLARPSSPRSKGPGLFGARLRGFLALALLTALAAPLARAEAPARSAAVRHALDAFATWDTDADGSLSLAELDSAIASPSVTGESAAAAVALRRLARNRQQPINAFTRESLVELAPSIRFEDTRDDGSRDDADPGATAAAAAASRSSLDRAFDAALRRIHDTPRELFTGPPTIERLRQGRLGSCFSLAPLIALTHARPEAVPALFAPAPDGSTITVTFGADNAVTITPLTDGEIALGADSGGTGLWAATYEKAVGELRRQSAAPGSAQASATPYAVVTRGGSAGTMLSVLTGHAIKRVSCRAWLPSSTATEAERAGKIAELRAELAAASAEGRLMTAGTSPRTRKVPALSQNHAFAVLGYDPATDLITFRDPHGQNFTPTGPAGLEHGYTIRAGRFEVPVAEAVYLMAGFAFQLPTRIEHRGYPANAPVTGP